MMSDRNGTDKPGNLDAARVVVSRGTDLGFGARCSGAEAVKR